MDLTNIYYSYTQILKKKEIEYKAGKKERGVGFSGNENEGCSIEGNESVLVYTPVASFSA